MNITNRLYTYPILSDEKDDYDTSVFQVTTSAKMNGVNSLFIQIDIKMNNIELNQLIRDGEAEYVLHLECSTTAFRTVVSSSLTHMNYEIPINRINGKLEMVAFIVSNTEIKDFWSEDWNEDYDGLKFDFAKASVLAYQNLTPLDITKDYEELINASSIFLVYKKPSDEVTPMNVDLDGGKIRIGLGSDEYDIYSRFCNKVEFQPILNSMIILPSLVYVFEELRQDEGIECNEGKEWYISLNTAYKKRGIDLIDEIQDINKSSIKLAQEAMELPINNALSKMAILYETEEEEE